jgi:hypothetical protein
MQPFTTLRTQTRVLAMASVFALAVSGLPAVHAFAEPRGGAGGADTRPDNATCEFVTAGFYDCTTPDGGEWYCTNDTDPSACVQIHPPNPSQTGTSSGQGFVHPVVGGSLTIGYGGGASPVIRPFAPVRGLQTAP